VGDLAAHVDREVLLADGVEVLAVPGMSSTPSINAISQSSAPGRTGANPTPQLPVTTVVTP
jgi:hypothetical protein